jgi:hypothetical protein
MPRKLKPESIRVKKLSNMKLGKLLIKHEQKEIAEMYGVSETFLSKELQRRDMYKVNKRTITIHPDNEKYFFTPDEDEIKGHGEWQKLKESQIYKDVMNKS